MWCDLALFGEVLALVELPHRVPEHQNLGSTVLVVASVGWACRIHQANELAAHIVPCQIEQRPSLRFSSASPLTLPYALPCSAAFSEIVVS